MAIAAAAGSSPIFIPPVLDSRQTALDGCAAQIESVAKQVKVEIAKTGPLRRFVCPITADFPEDPVLTNCGHLFGKAAIERALRTSKECPACRASVTLLSPHYVIKEHIQAELQKEPVPVLPSIPELGERGLVEQYFQLATIRMDKGDSEGALVFLTQGLRYTDKSKDYATVPAFYDKIEDSEKALLSRIYLSLTQLKEGGLQEAIETLKRCGSEDQLKSLIVVLALHRSPSAENIELVLACARENPEESMFLCKQILSIAPDHLDTYKQLIPLIKDPTEKRELLLKAADVARAAGESDFEALCRKQAASPVAKLVVTREEWAAAVTLELPPYPPELQAFLEEDCTIWPGKKRSETHIVVPLFPQVDLNGLPIPLTLCTLHELDKNSGGPGCVWGNGGVPNPSADGQFGYAVMTKDLIPGSQGRDYEDQEGLLPDGYEVPGMLDAARALLWDNRRSGIRHLGRHNRTICKETFENLHGYVGFNPVGCGPSGLFLATGVPSLAVGIAGWRKF